MSLLEKLKKNSTIKEAAIMSKSDMFNDVELVSTPIPAMNIALSGDVNGGFGNGLTVLFGPSRHFKTGFTLLMAKSYLDKYPDSVMLFYDSEMGSPTQYFKTFGIDMNRVLYTPVANIEELKFDLCAQLDQLQKGDRVFIAIDSIGNIASKKEVDDALDGKSVADMSRAKALKSLFRIVTPQLKMKRLPLVAISHSYKTMEIYAKDVMSGGEGAKYAADTLILLGRQQEKDGTELQGYNFILNVDKSRFVREKSKIPIRVDFERGMMKYSGLLDIALEAGFVVKPSVGWYSRVDDDGVVEDRKWRAKETENAEFWNILLKSVKFQEKIRSMYQVGYGSIMSDDEIDAEMAAIEGEEE